MQARFQAWIGYAGGVLVKLLSGVPTSAVLIYGA